MRHLGGRLDVCVRVCKGRAEEGEGEGGGQAIHPGKSPEGGKGEFEEAENEALTVRGGKRHREMSVEGEEAQAALPKKLPKKVAHLRNTHLPTEGGRAQ